MTVPVGANPRLDSVAQRGFSVSLPGGFVELPLNGEFNTASVREKLVAKIAGIFNLDPVSDNAIAAAAAFTGVGDVSGDSGLDYAAIAFYASPEDANRPIMTLFSGVTIASEHQNPKAATSGLLETYDQSSAVVAEEIQLPVGSAVAAVTEEEQRFTISDETVLALTRHLSVWIPDPDGTTVGLVSVTTNSYQDWEHVCVLGLDIADTFEWEDLG